MSTTITAFITRHRIRMACDWADSNPHMENSGSMNHFRCTLKLGRKRLTTPFSQGYGISGEPTIASVLDCLASDAAGIENARSFEDWAGEYGYELDSRKAERTYRICEQQTEKLRAFLGELYDALLYHTERE